MAGEPVEVGLSLGSNLGDRMDHLRRARAAIAGWPGVEVLAVSPVYETEPVGVSPEFAGRTFLNAVLILRCGLGIEELNERLHALEGDMGRRRTADRNAPRPIDVDIIYAGDRLIDGERLSVPHSRWAQRRFVVQPLADVRPGLGIPGAGRSVADVLASLPESPAAARVAGPW